VATLKAFSKVYQIPLADLIASESAYGNT